MDLQLGYRIHDVWFHWSAHSSFSFLFKPCICVLYVSLILGWRNAVVYAGKRIYKFGFCRFPSEQRYFTLTSTAMEVFVLTFWKSSGALLLQFLRYNASYLSLRSLLPWPPQFVYSREMRGKQFILSSQFHLKKKCWKNRKFKI